MGYTNGDTPPQPEATQVEQEERIQLLEESAVDDILQRTARVAVGKISQNISSVEMFQEAGAEAVVLGVTVNIPLTDMSGRPYGAGSDYLSFIEVPVTATLKITEGVVSALSEIDKQRREIRRLESVINRGGIGRLPRYVIDSYKGRIAKAETVVQEQERIVSKDLSLGFQGAVALGHYGSGDSLAEAARRADEYIRSMREPGAVPSSMGSSKPSTPDSVEFRKFPASVQNLASAFLIVSMLTQPILDSVNESERARVVEELHDALEESIGALNVDVSSLPGFRFGDGVIYTEIGVDSNNTVRPVVKGGYGVGGSFVEGGPQTPSEVAASVLPIGVEMMLGDNGVLYAGLYQEVGAVSDESDVKMYVYYRFDEDSKEWVPVGDVPVKVVTASALNIRSGPGTNYPKVRDPLRNGAMVVLAVGEDGKPIEKAGWYQIIVGSAGETAWVSGMYLRNFSGRVEVVEENGKIAEEVVAVDPRILFLAGIAESKEEAKRQGQVLLDLGLVGQRYDSRIEDPIMIPPEGLVAVWQRIILQAGRFQRISGLNPEYPEVKFPIDVIRAAARGHMLKVPANSPGEYVEWDPRGGMRIEGGVHENVISENSPVGWPDGVVRVRGALAIWARVDEDGRYVIGVTVYPRDQEVLEKSRVIFPEVQVSAVHRYFKYGRWGVSNVGVDDYFMWFLLSEEYCSMPGVIRVLRESSPPNELPPYLEVYSPC